MTPRLPIDPPPPSTTFADALADGCAYLVVGLVVFNGVVAIVAWLRGAL